MTIPINLPDIKFEWSENEKSVQNHLEFKTRGHIREMVCQ